MSARARLAAAMVPNGDLWALAGPHNAKRRTQVMATLLGVDRVPQSRAGVNAMRAEFYAQLGITGDCEAARERAFREAIRNLAP